MDPRRFAARLSQAAEVLQGKWRLGQWPNGQSEQQERVVVGGRPVEVDDLARQATVDEDPLAAAANRDGDRLHRRPAVGVPVAGDVIVEVAAPQAVGAVIAVVGAGGVQGDVEPAVPAAECLAGGVVAALVSASIGQRRTSGCVRTGLDVAPRSWMVQAVARRDTTRSTDALIGHHLSSLAKSRPLGGGVQYSASASDRQTNFGVSHAARDSAPPVRTGRRTG
jgi:hypothetical protein